jgi:hypothetical protein
MLVLIEAAGDCAELPVLGFEGGTSLDRSLE